MSARTKKVSVRGRIRPACDAAIVVYLPKSLREEIRDLAHRRVQPMAALLREAILTTLEQDRASRAANK